MTKPQKIAYSFGAIATALSYQAFSTYIIFFYVDVQRLTASLAAVAMLIYAFWNAINDPIAGFISDRTRTKFGRRIPYIMFFAIPFGIIYFFLWATPSGMQQISLFIYFLVFICLFDGLYSIVVLNWAALYPEMFPKLEERTEVNSYRQAFGMIGLMIGIALPPMIYGTFGWKTMGLIFGILIAVAYLVSLLGSKEKREFMQDKALGLKDAILNTFKNRSFLTFVISNLFIQYAFTMVLAMIPFYAKYVLKIRSIEMTLMLMATFVVAFFMMFIWRAVANRFGARNSYLIAILYFAVSLLPFIFFKNYAVNIMICGSLGVGLAGIILISDVIISDVIDADELKTNTRREGMYFGVNAFVTRFAIALEALSIGVVFNLTGYNPYIFTQTRSFLTGIKILMAIFPAIAFIIALGIMIMYPLHGKVLDELRRNLDALHVKKSKRLAGS
ncbi:MFS transporter [Candidatus Margulisiibacteriota bacterium]